MRPFGRLLLAVFAATAAATPRGAAREAAPPQLGDRSHAVYDLTCASELGRRQVTLFANGTIRLRDQVGKIAEMRLGELTRGELEGYLRRMAEEDLSEVDDTRLGPSG
ncbi:MAG TPA: hypothetical protein VMT16_01840, partial [Thermoanaerobaculia bacterium]|nr:hypothetical protein [Thermoanaerobaculia bacterium]